MDENFKLKMTNDCYNYINSKLRVFLLNFGGMKRLINKVKRIFLTCNQTLWKESKSLMGLWAQVRYDMPRLVRK